MKKEKIFVTDFKRIFEPERLAVIGVSTEGFGFGRGILLSLISIGYSGKIYPVNPKGGEIKGLEIFKRIEDIPDNIDFAIIAVPAVQVPPALEACCLKGAAGAEIFTSGFDEIDTDEGKRLNQKIKEIAAKGIRVIGPNCFGIYCPKSGLTLLPGPDLSREPGGVAFISQSGGMAVDFGFIGMWKGIKFSKVISFGNGADLRETELLSYLADDPDTEIITMYMEGVENGTGFTDTLRKAASRKPVIIIKGGTSNAGQRAVESHTASMGGQRIIWESMFAQCGAVRAANLRELSDTALAFSMLPGKSYRGVSIIGGGGALGVAATDTAEALGFEIPELDASARERIMKILPKPGSSARNPVDVANPYAAPEVLRDTIIIASRDERIDIHLVTLLLYHYKSLALMLDKKSILEVAPFQEHVLQITAAMKKASKPVIVVMPNFKQESESMDIEGLYRETRRLFLENGIPVFEDVTDALKAVKCVSGYYERRNRRF
ncbi:MAG: CoA-binding protein [Spirochaetes bacterium]|nr:CoA-binding protein [Spirochaetota bacterium]